MRSLNQFQHLGYVGLAQGDGIVKRGTLHALADQLHPFPALNDRPPRRKRVSATGEEGDATRPHECREIAPRPRVGLVCDSGEGRDVRKVPTSQSGAFSEVSVVTDQSRPDRVPEHQMRSV